MEENKQDVILEGYCEECSPKLVGLVEYVRQLENGQVAAKEALDTLMMTVEKLQEELEKYKQKNKVLTQADIKKKMDDLYNAEKRLVNRKNLGVSE